MQGDVAVGGPTIYFDDSKLRRLRMSIILELIIRMSIIQELIIRKTIAKTKKKTNMLCPDFQE